MTDIEDQVCDLIQARKQMGRKKYGVALHESGLTSLQLKQHRLEELLDAAIYLKAEIETEKELLTNTKHMNTFDPKKPVQRRDGKIAAILSTGCKLSDGRSIIALVTDPRDGVQCTSYHYDNGRATELREEPFDLINIPEPAPEPRKARLWKLWDKNGEVSKWSYIGLHPLISNTNNPLTKEGAGIYAREILPGEVTLSADDSEMWEAFKDSKLAAFAASRSWIKCSDKLPQDNLDPCVALICGTQAAVLNGKTVNYLHSTGVITHWIGLPK